LKLQSNLFTTRLVTLKVPTDTKEIQLIPLGDIHYGCSTHAAEEFDEFCAWAATQRDTYYLGMGDYFDMLSGSERAVFASSSLHDTTRWTIEEWWEDLVHEFIAKTPFMHGRVIGLMEGNHFANMSCGFTTTQLMVQEYNKHLRDTPGIRCEYLGVNSMIRIQLKYGGTHRCSVDVFAHHGRGAARTSGGSINTVEQMAAVADANIYLMGHDHKKMSIPDCKLRPVVDAKNRTLMIKDRPILYVRTGSFLKGYEPDRANYIVSRGYRPLQLGVVRIHIKLRRNSMDGWEPELEATA
jgi:hypothetical protein